MAERITAMTGSPISEDKVKQKIKDMKKRYKILNKKGKDVGREWVYYDDMDRILNGSVDDDDVIVEIEFDKV